MIVADHMGCVRCRHTYQVHDFKSSAPDSILRVGRCLVTGCDCPQFVDKIEKIDEDLL